MTATANQLIAKALSTASEDEAIACLRMARKRGVKMSGDIPEKKPVENASDLAQWKKIAQDWKNLYFSSTQSIEYNRQRADKYFKENIDLHTSNDTKTALLVFAAFAQVVSFITILHLNGIF